MKKNTVNQRDNKRMGNLNQSPKGCFAFSLRGRGEKKMVGEYSRYLPDVEPFSCGHTGMAEGATCKNCTANSTGWELASTDFANR